MKNDCNQYATLITGLVDGELDAETKHFVESHLGECQKCSEEHAHEKQIKALVNERVKIQKVPAYLSQRIRRQLVREGERPGFWELIHSLFIYRPAAATVALAFIGLLVILPIFRASELMNQQVSTPLDSTAERAITGELTGEVLCLDCEYMSRFVSNVKHDPVTHRPAIRCKDGIVWTLLQSNTARKLFEDPEAFRKTTVVSGVLFRKTHYVMVEDYRVL